MQIGYKNSPGIYSVKNLNVNTSYYIYIDNQSYEIPYDTITTIIVKDTILVPYSYSGEFRIQRIGNYDRSNINGGSSIIGNATDR